MASPCSSPESPILSPSLKAPARTPAIEGKQQGNWSSESHDNEPSQVGQPAGKDDQTFIQSVATGELKCQRRAEFLWYLAQESIMPDFNWTIEWEEEAQELVVGFIEEGLWVWMDGDEEYLAAEVWRTPLPQRAAERIAEALQRNQERTKWAGLRLRAATPAIRCGVVCWLALESTSAKQLDERRGLTARSWWLDPVERWRDGMRLCKPPVLERLAEISDQLQLYEAFSAKMAEAGHSCHQYAPHLRQGLKSWLLIQFIESRENKLDGVCLKRTFGGVKDGARLVYVETVFWGPGDCGRCRESARNLSTEVLQQPDNGYRIPRVLVLLETIIAYANSFQDGFQDVLHISHLENLQPLPFPLQTSTLQRVESMLSEIPQDPPLAILLPWTNAFPRAWRWRICRRPPSYWRRLNDLLFTKPNSDVPPSTGTLEMSGWAKAVWLLLWGKDQASPLEVLDIAKELDIDDVTFTCLRSLLPPSPTHAELAFKASLQHSSHSCWTDEHTAQYAQTMSALLGTDDIPVVGFISNNRDCLGCQVEAWVAREIQGDRKPPALLALASEAAKASSNSATKTTSESALQDKLRLHHQLLQSSIAFVRPKIWLSLQTKFVSHDFRIPGLVDSYTSLHLYAPLYIVDCMSNDASTSELNQIQRTFQSLSLIEQLSAVHQLQQQFFALLPAAPFTVAEAEALHMLLLQDFHSICAALLVSFEDEDCYERLGSMGADYTQKFLDLLQEVIDFPELPIKFRGQCIRQLIRLCRKFEQHPDCLSISGLQSIGDFAVTNGGYGDIYKGLLGGISVSVKAIKVYEDSSLRALLKDSYREAIIWTQLNHPNVLPFLGLYYLDSRRARLCLVAPWMENGNLTEFLKRCDSNGEMVNRSSLAFDVIRGIEYLHDNQIIHGDLKGANILITPSNHACIVDFGFAMVVESSSALQASFSSTSTRSNGRGGTVRWLSPELFQGDAKKTTASDIYAYACICYEMFSGKYPFLGKNDGFVILSVARGDRPTRPDHADLQDDLWALVERCWAQDPALRPSASFLGQQHPIFGFEAIPSAENNWDSLIASRLRSSFRSFKLCPSLDELNGVLKAEQNDAHNSTLEEPIVPPNDEPVPTSGQQKSRKKGRFWTSLGRRRPPV